MKYKLSEIMDIIGGGTPKTSKPEYWNGDIPWLSVKDINNDYRYVYETEKTITQAGLDNSSTKILKRNDSIISARGTVGEIAMIPFSMAFNQSCYGLRAKESLVDAEYLYYLIKHFILMYLSATILPPIVAFDRIRIQNVPISHTIGTQLFLFLVY